MSITTRAIPLIAIILTVLTPMYACQIQQVPGTVVKVAKVDTEYIYEGNIDIAVRSWRESQRSRLSNFIGFTPNEILQVRELAIISEIRKEIKRLPGVEISSQEKTKLADRQVEELAWDIYRQLVENPGSFADLAMRWSEAPSARNGGQLLPFTGTNNPETYQSLAYTMGVGEISEPFKSWDGWRIIRLDAINEDELNGTSYTISMILLTPNQNKAEDTLIDKIAEEHTIEILDPKYNARRSYIQGDYQYALEQANSAVVRDKTDDLAYYLQARCLWQLDRKDEAIDAMTSAAANGKVADGLIPYYHFFSGQYYEELKRPQDALTAYQSSYVAWQQDYTISLSLLDAFTRLGDTVNLAKMQAEIDSMRKQDRTTLFYSPPDFTKAMIVTGSGTFEDISAVYEPGYRAKDE